jgi:hypothetical protein
VQRKSTVDSRRDTSTKYGNTRDCLRILASTTYQLIRARSSFAEELRMEDFFTTTRRLPERHPYFFAGRTEVELAVSIEAFMNHPWGWSAFYAFATDDEGGRWKALWITDNTFICAEYDNVLVEDQGGQQEYYQIQHATFTTTCGERYDLVLAMGYTETASLSAEAYSVFWHAVTTSNCVKLKLHHWDAANGLCSGPALSQLFELNPSLELLEFEDLTFDEASCRALATLERTDLEVAFDGCYFEPRGAKDAVIEWLRHSQVVTKLEGCAMNDSIISALSENTSVKVFSFLSTTDRRSDLAGALAGNQGIENLTAWLLSDETWSVLLRSLWAHPRIHSVRLFFLHPRLSAASKTSMNNAVLRLVQRNTVVHTIDLPDYAKDEEFFQNFIVPRLEMNRSYFEDQRQALTRANPSVRGQLLGRALHVVRSNPDLLFRLLSENVPAFVLLDDEDDPVIPWTWCCLLRGTYW